MHERLTAAALLHVVAPAALGQLLAQHALQPLALAGADELGAGGAGGAVLGGAVKGSSGRSQRHSGKQRVARAPLLQRDRAALPRPRAHLLPDLRLEADLSLA